MHRFRFVFWLSVVITSVSGHLKVQAQDSQAFQVSSLSQGRGAKWDRQV